MAISDVLRCLLCCTVFCRQDKESGTCKANHANEVMWAGWLRCVALRGLVLQYVRVLYNILNQNQPKKEISDLVDLSRRAEKC